MKKKLLTWICVLTMLVGLLSGCASNSDKASGNSNEKTDAYPSENITILVPWGVGGGADLISRKVAEVIPKNIRP